MTKSHLNPPNGQSLPACHAYLEGESGRTHIFIYNHEPPPPYPPHELSLPACHASRADVCGRTRKTHTAGRWSRSPGKIFFFLTRHTECLLIYKLIHRCVKVEPAKHNVQEHDNGVMISTPYDLSVDMDIMDLVCDLMYTKLVITVKNILLENTCSYLIFIECISQQVELVGKV